MAVRCAHGRSTTSAISSSEISAARERLLDLGATEDDIARLEASRKPEADWWPGLQNAHVEFDFNERSGKGQLNVQDGHVALVNWLDDPLVPVKSFSTALSWGKKQDRWQIRLQNAQVNNADGQGSFELNWEEGDTKLPMGRLDLQIQVQRLRQLL